jgi:23S rRNA (guanosine2251-2'-O)-methyltransferase
MKASAGALNRIPVCRVPQVEEAYASLQLNGLKVYASSLQAEKKIEACDFTVPAAIVMGAEESGIGAGTMRKADELFIIPTSGETDSLNVSVATGVILYEVNRQRQVKA